MAGATAVVSGAGVLPPAELLALSRRTAAVRGTPDNIRRQFQLLQPAADGELLAPRGGSRGAAKHHTTHRTAAHTSPSWKHPEYWAGKRAKDDTADDMVSLLLSKNVKCG